MVRGKLVVDGVQYKWLPNSIDRTPVDFRTGGSTAGARGVLQSVAARSGRRQAGQRIVLGWTGDGHCSQLLYDHLLCLHQLKRPFYLRYDDVFASTGEALNAHSSTVFMFSSRHVKPADWTPVSRVDWTGCILVDGVAASTSAFEVDEEEGVVTFDTAPSGVVTAQYVAHLPVVVLQLDLSPVPQKFVTECGPVMACQGSVTLLTVDSALDVWSVHTGCLLEEELDSSSGGGGNDDDWFETIEPPLPSVTRRTKIIVPAISKSQSACGNGVSTFGLTWPTLDLPYNAHLLKSTLSATIHWSGSGAFWVAPISQDIDTMLVEPNAAERMELESRIGDEVSINFTMDRLASYVSPYWDATNKVMDWRWLAGKLNTLDSYDTLTPVAALGPTLDGIYNYIELEPDTAMGALMTAAGSASNYEMDGQGISGSGSLDWEGASAGVKYGVEITKTASTIDYAIWPGTPTSPIPSPTFPDTIEWVRTEAKIVGSFVLLLRWKRGHDLGKLKRIKANWTIRCFGQATAPAHYDTDHQGKSKWARARVGTAVEELDNPTDVDATLTAEAEQTFEEWLEFDEASQVARSRAVALEAAARSHSGTHTVDRTAGTWDAQAGIQVELNSLSCGGQLLDLTDVSIVAEWLPLSLWPLVPDAAGEVGSINGAAWTASDTIPLGDALNPLPNSVPGDGFNGGYVAVPDHADTSGALWTSLDHALGIQAPPHGGDKVTGCRISFDARTPAGAGTVSPAILLADLTNLSSWTSGAAQPTTDLWQSFLIDLPYSGLVHESFTTISDLAPAAFGLFSASAFEVRNIRVAVYYIHEDV